MPLRTQDGSTEETDERDCPTLCFYDVPNDINVELSTCLIHQNRNRHDIAETPTNRLVGGTTAVSGAYPYVVRLAFQNFDQFHSDSQARFQISFFQAPYHMSYTI